MRPSSTSSRVRCSSPCRHRGFEGSEGDERLQFAISLGKPILVAYLRDRAHLPLPGALRGYSDYKVVIGDVEDFGLAVRDYFEAVPGTKISIADGGGYDPVL